jgi:hypothetical protein
VVEEQTPDRPHRPPARRWLTSAAVVALLVAMAVHVARTPEVLTVVQRLSLQVLIAACLLQFLSQLSLNGSLLLPLQTCVTRLGFWELYVVRSGGFLVGTLVPVALGAAAVLTLLATAVLWTIAGRPPGLVLAVAAGVLAVSVGAVAAFELLPGLARHPRFQKWSWLSGMAGLSGNRRMTAQVFALSLVRHGLNFTTFGLLTHALSRTPGDFLTGGLVYALTSPVRMINVTPGNLGVTEWVVALVGKALAYDLATGLIVALAFRGIALVAQALGMLFGSAWVALGREA